MEIAANSLTDPILRDACWKNFMITPKHGQAYRWFPIERMDFDSTKTTVNCPCTLTNYRHMCFHSYYISIHPRTPVSSSSLDDVGFLKVAQSLTTDIQTMCYFPPIVAEPWPIFIEDLHGRTHEGKPNIAGYFAGKIFFKRFSCTPDFFYLCSHIDAWGHGKIATLSKLPELKIQISCRVCHHSLYSSFMNRPNAFMGARSDWMGLGIRVSLYTTTPNMDGRMWITIWMLPTPFLRNGLSKEHRRKTFHLYRWREQPWKNPVAKMNGAGQGRVLSGLDLASVDTG